MRQSENIQLLLQLKSISPNVEFHRLFPKVRIYIIGAVDLCGKSKHYSYESSKNRLETRSHVISLEEVARSSPEVEKALIW